MSNRYEEGRDDVAGWWRTSVSRVVPGELALRGYPIEQLVGKVSFVETVWLLLRGDLPDPGSARLLEAALVAAADHGPQAPSIAAARMAATCGVGLNSAVATGVNLLGDVHGGAGQQCLALMDDVRHRELAGEEARAVVAAVVADHRRRGAPVPGFGHRFHPRDPRRDPLLGLVREHVAAGAAGGHHLRIAELVEEELAQGATRPVPMNVDGATAVVFGELGFAPELARGLFVLSRAAGILAHAWEERQGGGRIKGPLPPDLLAPYSGPDRRDLR